MIIHLYTPEAPPWSDPGSSRIGHGLGSLFGRLFSRTIAKTVAKTAGTAIRNVARTGVKLGRKALTTAVKKAAPLARDALKEGISAAADFGSEKAVQGIQKLAEKSIKHGAPESLAHSLAKAAEEGTKAVAKTSARTLNTSVDRILSSPIAPTLPPQLGTQSQHAKPRKPKQSSSKVRRPASHHSAPPKRQRTDKSISTLLDEI